MFRPTLTTVRPAARALSTSAAARSDARQITSDFLARLQMSDTIGGGSSSSTAASGSGAGADAAARRNTAARGMLSRVGLRDLTINDGREIFRDGNVTPPHAYNAESMYPEQKPKVRPPLLGPPRRIAETIDPFKLRGTNPLHHASNPLMCLPFVNEVGKLRPRAETGLTWRSQRLVGKMVRRARAMGVISRWSNQVRSGGLGDGM